MPDYEISGTIKDSTGKPLTNLLVQAFDSDQGLIEDRNDDLLGSCWVKQNGTFTIDFDEKQFKENFLERGPDLYLIVRNQFGQIIHTTPIRRNVSPSDTANLMFDEELSENDLEPRIKPTEDPYADNMSRRIEAFSTFGQRANFTDDLQRSFTLLLSTLNAWTGYNNELSWDRIGYDGPQVDRYPWRTNHKPHTVKWKK